MSRELVFLPAVSRDFIEGFDYYEALSPGRGGARFEGAYRQALQQVKAGLVSHFSFRLGSSVGDRKGDPAGCLRASESACRGCPDGDSDSGEAVCARCGRVVG